MSGTTVESTHAEVTPRQRICENTDAKTRTFLYQVAEGVADYRSLHSLTQQVEHQYRGRFLIEMRMTRYGMHLMTANPVASRW